MNYIGIDIGTSTIASVLFSTESNEILIQETADNDATVPTGQPWEHIQDPYRIYRIIEDLTQKISNAGFPIHGIGLTGQMHGFLYVDASGGSVSPLYTWCDNRGARQAASGRSYAAELSRRTGYQCAPGFGLVTHFFNIEENCLPTKAFKMATIHDFIGMKLTGNNIPKIDPTDAASWGVFDLKSLDFDRNALRDAGIISGILPTLVEAAALLGHTSQGVPVYNAIGDNQAGILGSVRKLEKSLLINIGTGSQISAYSPEYFDVKELDARPFPGGGYIFVGAPLCGGKAYAALADFFKNVCTVFSSKSVNLTDIYAKMNSIDYETLVEREVPIVIPTFLGTRRDPDKRGEIKGLNLSNFNPEHLVLGFLHGMAFELYEFYQYIPVSVRENITTIVGSGNGIRKNSVLQKTIMKHFYKPIHLAPYPEEAAVGAALGAAVGNREIPAFKDVGLYLYHSDNSQ